MVRQLAPSETVVFQLPLMPSSVENSNASALPLKASSMAEAKAVRTGRFFVAVFFTLFPSGMNWQSL